MPVIKGLVKDENDELASNILVRAYRNDNGVLLDSNLTGPSDEIVGDPYYDNVSLLLHCDGTDGSTTFTDNSSSPKTVTVYGNAHIETDQSKFGGASAYFDGSDDYLGLTSDTSLNFGTAPWTVEFWMYYTGTGNPYPCILGVPVGWSAGVVSITMDHAWAVNKLAVTAGSAGNIALAASTTLSLNTWYHCAVVRNGASLATYINGAASGSSTISTSLAFNFANTGTRIGGGNGDGANSAFAGYLDDIRITKGVARYTADFTPPTSAFLTIAISSKSLGQYQIFTEYTSDVNVIAINPLTGITTNDLGLKTIPIDIEATSTDVLSFKSLISTELPAASDVRYGTAVGNTTGTAYIPAPANVALGIPVDNTVGTAILTLDSIKEAVWDIPVTNLTSEDSIGLRIRQAATISSSGAQLLALTE